MTVQNELLSDEEHRKIEELVEQEEGGVHRFASWWGTFLTAIAVAMTLFHLYAAASTVDQQSLREIHVAFALSLVFLLFPMMKSWRNRIAPWDIVSRRPVGRGHLVHDDGRHLDEPRGGRRLSRPLCLAHAHGRCGRRRAHPAGARGDAASDRLDHADRCR